jgi:hypothetical protein
MSPSTTARCLPHSGLELRVAEAIVFTSQPEADLQETPVEESPENEDIPEQSASQVADRYSGQYPLNSSRKSGDEAN